MVEIISAGSIIAQDTLQMFSNMKIPEAHFNSSHQIRSLAQVNITMHDDHSKL